MSFRKEMMPRFSTANNDCYGTLLEYLVKLTEAKLPILILVKTYGYYFSSTGGCNKQLKGSI